MTRRARGSWRSLAPLCAALLALVGSLGVHRDGEAHRGLTEATISIGARHADEEAHLETGAEQELGRCSICLLRSRSDASDMRRTPGWPPPLARGGAVSSDGAAVSGVTALLTPSRAPPSPLP